MVLPKSPARLRGTGDRVLAGKPGRLCDVRRRLRFQSFFRARRQEDQPTTSSNETKSDRSEILDRRGGYCRADAFVCFVPRAVRCLRPGRGYVIRSSARRSHSSCLRKENRPHFSRRRRATVLRQWIVYHWRCGNVDRGRHEEDTAVAFATEDYGQVCKCDRKQSTELTSS